MEELRFAETEARVGAKVEEFQRQLSRTQRLMGEIQREMDARKRPRKEAVVVVAVVVEQRPIAPETEEEAWIKPLKQPPPAVAKTNDQTISFAYRQCQACGQSSVLPQCAQCLQWTHPSCPEPAQPCSCTPIPKPILTAASSPNTPPLLPPTAVTSRRSPRLVHSTTRCNEKTGEARARTRTLLQANVGLVREIFQRQHELAAARTDPVLVCKQTGKGLWTPQDDDLVLHRLIGHAGKAKPEQCFQVRWRSIEIGPALLRSSPNDALVSHLFQDPRDTTAVFHALSGKL